MLRMSRIILPDVSTRRRLKKFGCREIIGDQID
jgi:hypothetical protein